ncbi:MAG: hypothetical protein IPK27_13115 [Rhodanobacteraceae bacterium]|nr:hypothetical protein [Rhodanobacteraceae bacterium]
MRQERKAALHRYRARFMGAMAVYAALIVLMLRLVKGVEPLWAKAIMVLVPMVPIVVALSEMLRFFASLDELERRVHFEAVTTAAILTCMLTFAWGLLELAGLPKVPVLMVLPLFCGIYGPAVWWATRKYA